MTDRCEPPPELHGVEWFDNPHIMTMWDSWRRYIADGGGASWPRDAFESLLDTHDAEVTTLRARVARMEEALRDIVAMSWPPGDRSSAWEAAGNMQTRARAALSAETP